MQTCWEISEMILEEVQSLGISYTSKQPQIFLHTCNLHVVFEEWSPSLQGEPSTDRPALHKTII